METKLSILFYSKTSKTTKDGLVPIYLRVTINGARFEQAVMVAYAAMSKKVKNIFLT
ncbi:Arm DNA-binding domain-containing protein [Parafilimonas sp.]|uniref:Arm DNA-binding domain-containing protein n=1 Tax=Parafilimonas sp. TaxID=1969739 RepID=UPI0039E437B0